ncbi:phage tail domain-containing protein [Kitasatospora sp. A2-31]|uniref:phage tail domain-containing protein n=1 Tax=Kitasatospora sp. A2-31 TaxID=2916414 RepID=UPI001EED2416|nr:phage tail domain-containing protein [Kitasatospora sp. A2-31]MCG6499468.1 phage tail family protein [Kitasatospora sp. A2-31]
MAGYTPGQVLGRTVTLGSLQLGVVDAAGVAWTVSRDGLRGWSGAPVRTQYSDREADHGAWAGPTYLGARVITLAGTITAPDLATLDAAAEQLYAAAALTDTTLVVGESVPKQATVRRSGDVLCDYETDRVARYSVMLTAADPRRYSTTLQSQSAALPSVTGGLTLPITLPIMITATTASGTISLTNQGTIATRPVLTVTGPCAGGFTIVAARPSGATTQQTYSDSLAAGDVLVIDSLARTVTLNGSVSRRRYLSGTWPEIPPQSSLALSWTCPSYDPSALLTGTCRSAWL